MLDIQNLPTLNALLNATSATLLIAGYIFIRRRNIAAHRACMLGAVIASAAFFVSYAIYHAHAGATKFAGTGWVRPVYFAILISHTFWLPSSSRWRSSRLFGRCAAILPATAPSPAGHSPCGFMSPSRVSSST